MANRDYMREVENMATTSPASKEEKQIEAMAMFLCDTGIVVLGPSGDGDRLSTGHGWHRTRNNERDMYREQAKLAIAALTKRQIP